MKLFKKFIRYYRPYRKVFYLDMVCALVISVIDLAFPRSSIISAIRCISLTDSRF